MLFDVYNEAFKVGSLPQLMHSGLITFIPKTVKDPLDPSGYRPIPLHTKIHAAQSGFVLNWYGSDNIRRLVNLPNYVALSLDASKAFDCVEWEDLFKT